MSDLSVRGAEVALGGRRVLQGVDLEVRRGRVAAVLGPSGCGKTTLLRVVAGLQHLDAGEVRIADTLVNGGGIHLPAERRGVALVPQEGALFPHLDVAGNVAFGLPGGARRNRERVERVLDLVGLAGFGSRRPAHLSGGQQQRVAVARALAPDPALVLLDEPFSALDAGLREEVRHHVRQAFDEAGSTVLMVTHDQDEALSLADTVAVMAQGCIVAHDHPERVYAAPPELAAARAVGRSTELAAEVRAGVAHTDLGPVQVDTPHPEGRGIVVLRPEALTLLPIDGAEGVSGEVVRVVYHGHEHLVVVRVAGHDLLVRTGAERPPGLVRVAVTGTGRFFTTGG